MWSIVGRSLRTGNHTAPTQPQSAVFFSDYNFFVFPYDYSPSGRGFSWPKPGEERQDLRKNVKYLAHTPEEKLDESKAISTITQDFWPCSEDKKREVK